MKNRRHGINRRVAHGGRTFTVTINSSDGPQPGVEPFEVFYSDGMREGTDLQHTVQDACIVISLALQAGVPVERLAKSMSGASVVSAIIGAMEGD